MSLKHKKIGVIMGGASGEREVSLSSGAAIVKALRARGYDVKEVVIDEAGVDQLKKADIDVAFIAMHAARFA